MSGRDGTPDTGALLDVAVEAAQAAGGHALQQWARRDQVVERSAHDVKLRLDLECQQIAEKVVSAAFPAHALLAEEDLPRAQPATAPNSDYQWVIDPIDGTVNFLHGLPFWCCSVACRHRGEAVAGVVFAPMLEQLYQAASDQPAVCNGEPIRVSTAAALSAAMILSSMDMDLWPGYEPLCIFKEIVAQSRKARILGAAALDLCLVAAGRADGYFESAVRVWDVAAGDLIVRQAGGRTETLRGPDPIHRLAFLASNGRVHEPLKALIAPRLEEPA